MARLVSMIMMFMTGRFGVREGRYVRRALGAHDINGCEACVDYQHARRTLDAEQRVRGASLRTRRLRAALDERQRQREEVARLREELAPAHGRVRELQLDRRVRRT